MGECIEETKYNRDQVKKTKVAETSVNVIVHDVRHVRMRYLLRLKKNEDDA